MSKYDLGFRAIIYKIEDENVGTIIESEDGNKYKLTISKNGQRKYSRYNGTKLRFMTYDNINKDFRIIDNEEIDIDSIKEVNHYDVISLVKEKTEENINNELRLFSIAINQLAQAVKQLNNK